VVQFCDDQNINLADEPKALLEPRPVVLRLAADQLRADVVFIDAERLGALDLSR